MATQKIAIGVGAAIGALLLLILTASIFAYRWHKKKEVEREEADYNRAVEKVISTYQNYFDEEQLTIENTNKVRDSLMNTVQEEKNVSGQEATVLVNVIIGKECLRAHPDLIKTSYENLFSIPYNLDGNTQLICNILTADIIEKNIQVEDNIKNYINASSLFIVGIPGNVQNAVKNIIIDNCEEYNKLINKLPKENNPRTPIKNPYVENTGDKKPGCLPNNRSLSTCHPGNETVGTLSGI